MVRCGARLRRAVTVVRLLLRPAQASEDAYARAADVYGDLHRLWLLVGGAASERRLLQDLHSTPLPGARILDAGCGTGRLARLVQQAEPTASMALLDTSATMLGRVDPELGPRVRGSVLALLFPDETFDLAIAAWSLETTADPQRGLDECLRVLRPGGVLIAAFCAAPTSRLARAATCLPRRVVASSFAGHFLDPMMRPTAAHHVLHRTRGRLQISVHVSFRRPD